MLLLSVQEAGSTVIAMYNSQETGTKTREVNTIVLIQTLYSTQNTSLATAKFSVHIAYWRIETVQVNICHM